MKRLLFYPGLIVILLLVACAPAAPEPTATPETGALDEATATSDVLPTRQPLPPTWTPGSVSTVTPFPTATLPYVVNTPRPSPTMAVDCADFDADYDRIGERFILGESPSLYWTVAASAPLYRVALYTPEGDPLWVQFLEAGSDTYTFPAELFDDVDPDALERGTVLVYGWEVTPVDERRSPYCDPAGGELIPMLPEPDSEGG